MSDSNLIIDKSKLAIGSKLYHMIFNTVEVCSVSSLEEFNIDPNTICVVFDEKDDSTIKVVSLDSVRLSKLENKGEHKHTSKDIINVLSRYLLKAFNDKSLIAEIEYYGSTVTLTDKYDENIIEVLLEISTYLWEHVINNYSSKKDDIQLKFIYAKLLYKIFEESNIKSVPIRIKTILLSRKHIYSLIDMLTFLKMFK